MTLTSASTPAAAPAAEAPAPVAPAVTTNVADEKSGAEVVETATAAAAKDAGAADPMSFAALSAALGDGENGENAKMSLDLNAPPTAPAGKGLSADGYAAVQATHQAVETASTTHAGDMKVGGGMTAAAVRAGVQEGASRLRACYAHGLVSNPRLAGRILVSFSVDARGAASDVTTESDAIPAEVTGCVRDAFSAMTFAPPKTAPAKVVYPVDFNKDS